MDPFVLEVLDGDRAGTHVTLGSAPLRIGRKPNNDLVLADEKTSGVHAEVVLEGDRYVLRDLGSTNGTFLDGRRISEVVLSPGDTFVVGRIQVRFGGGEAALADDGLRLERLDTSRLQRRGSRSVAVLGLLLAVAAGTGGYLWWQSRAAEGTGSIGPRGPQPPVVVRGNKLPPAVAACDAEEGWNLRLAGTAFTLDGAAHSGRGSLLGRRGEGAEEPGFAVARLAEPVTAVPGRSMTAVAHLRTAGSASATVRLWFGSSADSARFQFRTGAALQQFDGWTEVRTTAVVPEGTDRVNVEIVAVLPQLDASAWCDDVALLEVGSGTALSGKIDDAGATVLGTGHSLAIRSREHDRASLLAVVPGEVRPELRPLLEAGLLVLSDIGAALEVRTDLRGCDLVATGVERLQLVFDADAASGLLARTESGFGGVAAASQFTAAAVLLGDRITRCLVELASPGAVLGRTGGGRYRLVLPGPGCRLVLGFRQERLDAGDLLRQARQQLRDGKPGQALDRLQQLLQHLPHDAELLAQAMALRGEIQQELAARLRAIGRDLDEASFFETRGGFERVVQSLDGLRELYGEHNIEDVAAVAALRAEAAGRLSALDGQRAADERQRLLAMAMAFEAAQQADLARVVRDYLTRHLGGGQ